MANLQVITSERKHLLNGGDYYIYRTGHFLLGAFHYCTSLTSVTFEAGSDIYYDLGNYAFPEGNDGKGGNTLKTAYNAASPKEGTYTRAANGSTWSKQL